MSIKNFLAAAMAVIGGIMLLIAVLLFRTHWSDYTAAQDAKHLAELLGASTAVSSTQAAERGASGVALDGEAAAIKSMGETRQKLDEAFDAMQKLTDHASVEEAKDTAAAMGKFRSDVQAWRKQADATIGSDPKNVLAFREKYNAGMFEILGKMNTLTGRLGRALSAKDAQVATAASLAQTAWAMRDAAGRLSATYLAAVIDHRPLTQAQLRQIDRLHGQVILNWTNLTGIAAVDSTPVGIKTAIAKVDQDYIQVYKMLAERFEKHGFTDGEYDIDPVEWRRHSAPALQSIMTIRDAAIDAAREIADEEIATAERGLITLAALLGVTVLVVIFIARGVNNRVIQPIGALTAVIGRFADGERQFDVPYAERTDEMGKMGKAVLVLRDRAIAADESARKEAEAVRQREQHRQHIEDVTSGFIGAIDAVVGDVTQAVNGLRGETHTLTQASATTTEQSTVVAAASEQASSNVQTVAAAAKELSHSIQEISRRVAEAAATTDEAVHQAEATNETVRGLSDAARRIGDVVALITDIAAQTNLLALNATIEAARAGDAGKGFAVVAGEVKHLANQTAKATEDIQTQVSAIQAETEKAVTAIGGIAQTIAQVNQFTMGIASAVEQQGAATQEIARNVQQAAAGTAEVSSSIVGVMDAAQKTGGSAGHLSGLADTLAQQSDRLRQDVTTFIGEIKRG